MKILKLAAAAAIALTGLSLPAAPAAAQRWHHDNGRHNGWRNHHRTRTVCNWVGHGRHRHRVCRTVRW
ncbi:MAG: hypothetical protein JO276_02560 [Sphingomonadaceae bacterium]|nr:hypothetical protein [Sphingomonadaceae bacterium]